MKYFLTFLLVCILYIPSYSQSIYIGHPVDGDCDCNGRIDINDATRLINYIFASAKKPNCKPVFLKDNYSYLEYDSTIGNSSKKLIVEISEDTTWKKIELGCFKLDKSYFIRTYQKVSNLVIDSVLQRSDTTYFAYLNLEEAKPNDSCFMIIQK